MKHSTHIEFILDQSGSMGVIYASVVAGFDAFIGKQQELPGECTMTLRLFNDRSQLAFADRPIKDVKRLGDFYRPDGYTALYDAIGLAIDALGIALASRHEKDRPDNVIVVILTDGLENASTRYGSAMIQEKIKHQQEVYNWNFLYLGANQDAILEAAKIGIGANQSAFYNATDAGTQATYGVIGQSVSSTRMYGGRTTISDTQKDGLNKAK